MTGGALLIGGNDGNLAAERGSNLNERIQLGSSRFALKSGNSGLGKVRGRGKLPLRKAFGLSER